MADHTAKDIADFLFLLVPHTSTDDADQLTWRKLKYILYCAQGGALVWINRPLFAEDFIRGENENDPIMLPSIDGLYSKYRGAPLPFDYYDDYGLDKDEIKVLNWAYDMFGCYTPVALKTLVTNSFPVRRTNRGWIIPKRTMKSHFDHEYFKTEYVK